jgi:hypothetical protein
MERPQPVFLCFLPRLFRNFDTIRLVHPWVDKGPVRWLTEMNEKFMVTYS